MKNTEKWVVATVSLLLAYPAWVRGGTHSGYQAPMVWLAVAALVALAATRGRVRTRNAERGTRKESNAEGGTGQAEDHVGPSGQVVNEKRQEVSGKNSAFRVPLALRSLGEAGSSAFRDPVFYLAVLFLILIGVQWGNAGRALIFDYENHEWIYGAPRIAWLPSAVEAVEAKEMLLWFFPAFTVILCVRHGLSSRSSIRLLFRIMVLNACAVGVFGIVQFLSGTSSIYWRFPLKGQFFASFGYPNHAAAFFTLLLCLSLGLCIREVAGRGMERKRKGRIILLLVCALVCLAGANLSLSRAGIVASWLCVAIAGIYAIIVAFRNLSPAMRVNLIAGVLALTVLACFAVDWAARERLGKELEETANREKVISHLCGRWWQVTSAARIWKDHPWFGVGGWGYRHFAGMYLEPEQWSLLRPTGKANVHNDVMQFLAEFGAVGLGLLAVMVIVLIRPLLRMQWWNHGMMFLSLVGIGITFAHSMVDLPFRCPAVMWAWLAIVAGVGRYAESSPRNTRKTRKVRGEWEK